ncbi:MAG: FAD-dependent oxidoreductase [Pseudomonadota bacterium]
MERNEYDYVIVGGGTAGCALAGRLAEAGHQVALVEQGPPDDHPAIRDSRLSKLFALWRDKNYCRDYLMERAPGDPSWPDVLRGVTLGGCGSINVMIHLRGNRQDFDHWRDLGNPGWGFDEMLAYFKRSETYEFGTSTWRGGDGPIKVRRVGKSIYADAFERAAMEMGFYGPDWDFNGEQQQGGAGPLQFSVDEKLRRSSTVDYLQLSGDPDNPTRLTNHQALRLVFDECGNGQGQVPQVTGVAVLNPSTKTERVLHAQGEVILCCGTYETPKLLMQSGLGPPEHLCSFGIKPRKALPGVGQNLQDHVITSLFYQGAQPLPGLNFLSEIGLFVDIAPGKDLVFDRDGWPTVQFFMNAGVPERRWVNMPENYFAFFPSLTRPKSMGEVRLASPDPRRDPVIDPRYYSHPDDLSIMVNALRLAQKMAGTQAFSGLNLGPISIAEPVPLPELTPQTPPAEMEVYVRAYSRGLWHPVGTCKMGPSSDPMAVVDHRLQVHGVSGLRICDASIMPQICCGNTNATVIAIAEKAADMIGRSA